MKTTTKRRYMTASVVRELTQMGRELHDWLEQVHEGKMPSVEDAWLWLTENPGYWGYSCWTEDLPEEAPEPLAKAYLNYYAAEAA